MIIDRYFRFRTSEQHLHPVGRLELFGDGILAIAATLLVLALTVPEVIGHGGLRHVLYAQRFTFVAVLIGFFEIGGSWLMSRRLARLVTQVDHWATLIWMGAIFSATLIPFTTLVLARSFNRDDFGVGVMAVTVVTWIALMFTTAMVLYVKRAGLLRAEAEATYRPYLQIIVAADIVWALTIPLSLVVPWLAFAIVIIGYGLGLSPLPTEGRDSAPESQIVLND